MDYYGDIGIVGPGYVEASVGFKEEVNNALGEYSQSTGVLKFKGSRIATGYSGYGSGKNKPMMEHKRNLGPIPRGEYLIQAPRASTRTGPFVLPLVPVGHDALGRTDFQIHGDSRSNPGTASNGCIIFGRSVRQKIWNSEVRKLVVVR